LTAWTNDTTWKVREKRSRLNETANPGSNSLWLGSIALIIPEGRDVFCETVHFADFTQIDDFENSEAEDTRDWDHNRG
jgi:hypothetical protein